MTAAPAESALAAVATNVQVPAAANASIAVGKPANAAPLRHGQLRHGPQSSQPESCSHKEPSSIGVQELKDDPYCETSHVLALRLSLQILTLSISARWNPRLAITS